MINNLKELYKPSDGLYKNIINRIENEKNLIKVRRRLIISSVVFALSMVCFTLSAIFFLSAASQSGFSQIFSLIFSDFYVISSYSKNFILSLLESLPIFNIVLFLFTTLLVSFMAKFLTKDIKSFVFYNHVKY